MDDDDDRMLIPDSTVPEVEDDEVALNKRHSAEILQNFQRIGITLIVLGLTSIVICIITLSSCWYYMCDLANSGMWCGIFVVVLGCLAIVAKYHLNKGVVISNLVSASLATVFGVVNIIMSFIAALSLWWDDAAIAVLALSQCALTIAWTTLTIYHLIVVGRIMKSYDGNCSSTYCCLPPSMAGGGAAEIPIAYVPPGGRPNARPGAQTVFMAVPAYNTSQTV